MKVVASAEVDRDAFDTADFTRRVFLNAASRHLDIVASLDLRLAYIPIIMPACMHKRYRERFQFDIKDRTYYCSPRLRHEIFTQKPSLECFHEYISGITRSMQILFSKYDYDEWTTYDDFIQAVLNTMTTSSEV